MAHIYYANGEIKEVTPKNGTDFQLEELQEIVGGYIWVIGLKEDAEQRIIVMNDEGKLKGLQMNEKATDLAHEFNAIFTDDYIVGDVLVCNNSMVK